MSSAEIDCESVIHWVERDGVAVSWREAGRGPALILLHAFPLSASMWGALVQRWKRKFRILCPVWRGFDGPSPLSRCPDSVHGEESGDRRLPVLGDAGNEPSLTNYSEDVAAICSVAGIDSAIIAGCSMGGYVLFDLLRRHPALVRAAIFCDTRPGADSLDGRTARLETNQWLHATVEHAGLAAAGSALAERMLPRLLGASTREHRPEIVRQVRLWIEQAAAEAVIAANAAMAARPDSTALLPGLRIPTLVIAGKEDAIIPVEETTEFARRIPDAGLCLIPNAGHLLPVEAPAAFADALESWLQSQRLFPD